MTSFDIVDISVDLPDLNTVVGLYGTSAREELSGPGCLLILLGTIAGE